MPFLVNTLATSAFGKDGVRWRIALLLLLVTAINYLDRQAMAVAAPTLQKEFGLTKADYGLITSAFLFAYAVGQALSGRILDTIGTRRGFSWAVVLWSIAGILHIFGRGFWSFFALRALLGLFEGFNFPAAMKAIAEWFPRNDRALGGSIVRVGAGVGALLAPPVLGLLIYYQGWQAAFLVPGVIGFFWLILWLRYYRSPETHPSVTEREKRLILADRIATPQSVERIGWRVLIRRRELQGLMLARFFADNLLYFYLFWLPIYLSDARGFSLLEIGLFAWIPFLFSDLGGLFVGWLSGRLLQRGWTLDQARKRLLWAAGLMVPVASLAAVVESPGIALALISFGLFANQFKTTPLFTLPTDLFPPSAVGTAWGLCGAAGSVGAMLFQPAIGWLADNFSYVPVFLLVSVLPLIAAITVSLTVKTVEPINLERS
jgi:ACS family hexuronate transporter-like MFS transporter